MDDYFMSRFFKLENWNGWWLYGDSFTYSLSIILYNHFLKISHSCIQGCRKSGLVPHPCYATDTLEGWRFIFTLRSLLVNSSSLQQSSCILTQKNRRSRLYLVMASLASTFLSPLTAAYTSRCSLAVSMGHSTFSWGQYPRWPKTELQPFSST